jgi:hypothetical protein
MEENQPKRGRGRPKGSKTRPRPEPLAGVASRRALDPSDMVNDQLALLHYAQCSIRKMMVEEGMSDRASKNLLTTSQGIAKSIEALRRCTDLEDEMARRLSPEKLLEAAISKLESQNLEIISYAVKRLTDARRRLEKAPEAPIEGLSPNAVAAIAALGE